MREVTLKEFQKYLNRGITKATVKRALDRGCIVVENAAKRDCPVGRTGLLRASIKHRVDLANQEGIIGSALDYAPYVEFGTGIYARDGDGRKTPWVYHTADGEFHFTVGQHPQPYLEPALENNVNEISRVILETIKGELFKP